MTEPLKLFVFGVGQRVQQTAARRRELRLGQLPPFKGVIKEWDKRLQLFMIQWDGIPGPSPVSGEHIEPEKLPSRWDVLMRDRDAV